MRITDWTVNGDRLIIELSTYGDVVDVSKLKLEHLCVVKSCVTLELEIYAVGPGVRVRERCMCVCVWGGGNEDFVLTSGVCPWTKVLVSWPTDQSDNPAQIPLRHTHTCQNIQQCGTPNKQKVSWQFEPSKIYCSREDVASAREVKSVTAL